MAAALELPTGGYRHKFGWWTAREGRLLLTAARIDGPGVGTVQVREDTAPGLHASTIDFSDAGCWRLVGRLNADSLTVTLLVSE